MRLSLTESTERGKRKAMSFQPSAISQKRSGPKLTADRRSLTAVSAFTLIELLAVIAIIAILAAMTVGISKYAWTKAGTSRAQAEIAAMETALESYKLDVGQYPASAPTRANATNNATLYTALAGGSKKYMTFKPDQLRVSGTITNVIDPFGTPYAYFRSSDPSLVTNVVTFDLWSYGPDGKSGSTPGDEADDIANWKF
jgi:general secretion pathway protein G